MKLIKFLSLLIVTTVLLSSCTVLKAANYASSVFMMEEDTELAKNALPTMIKACEAMYFADTKNEKNAVQLASLYVMYANAFIDSEAFALPEEEYEKKIALTKRANALYKRATKILVPFTEAKAKNLFTDTENVKSKFKAKDVKLMYWTTAAILSAFSSDPMDFETGNLASGAVFLFEESRRLDPDWNNGSLHELGITVYGSLPQALGGDIEKAKLAFTEAKRVTEEKSPGTFVSYALSVCFKENNKDAFVEALDKALSLECREDFALMDNMSHRKAQKLLNDIDFYFYE